MKQYLDLLANVVNNGTSRKDRTGVGTRSIFGAQMRMSMQDGFPLLTTKKVHFKSVLYELLWFLRGDTNVKFLQDHGVTIWNEWADAFGDLGPVYGKQWRRWADPIPGTDGWSQSIDQIANLIEDLKTNPFSRRLIVSAWNPVDVPAMKLPPCHTLWQCYVRENSATGTRFLDLHLYARSIDIFLGLPFNIASYATLLHMLAWVTDMLPGELIISFGDLHLYMNHLEQAKEQLARAPGALPMLAIERGVRAIDDFKFEDFTLYNYNPQPAIKAPIAV
jgi:thymidylate synthase